MTAEYTCRVDWRAWLAVLTVQSGLVSCVDLDPPTPTPGVADGDASGMSTLNPPPSPRDPDADVWGRANGGDAMPEHRSGDASDGVWPADSGTLGAPLPSPVMINRVIPVSFVQFLADEASALSQSALERLIEDANVWYRRAGIRFFLHNSFRHLNATLAGVEGDVDYAWPAVVEDAPLVRDLGCPRYAALLESLPSDGVEKGVPWSPNAAAGGEVRAIIRAGAYCAPDGELVTYITDSNTENASIGFLPTDGNGILLRRQDAGAPLELRPGPFARVLSQVLGLAHTFGAESEVFRIKQTLTEDVSLADSRFGPFPGATSRRRFYGVGQGYWTDWKSLGSFASRPGVDVDGEHAFITSVRAPDGAVHIFDCVPGALRCTEESIGIGARGRSDVASGGGYLHAMAWSSSTAEAQLRSRELTPSGWSPASWLKVWGALVDSPVGTTSPDGRLDIVGRGVDNSAYFRSLNTDGGWVPALEQSWLNLGGALVANPAIGTRTTGEIDLVAHGAGGEILVKFRALDGTWDPSVTGWYTHLGHSVSAPHLAERPGGRADVAVRNSAREICINTLDAGEFSGWHCPGTVLWGSAEAHFIGAPSTASWSPDRFDVVARASDGSIVYKFFDDGAENPGWWPSPSEWTSLGGGSTSAEGDPVIVTTGVGKLLIVTLGDDGQLYYRMRDM